jgi:uncharacterized membrane-anchored protein
MIKQKLIGCWLVALALTLAGLWQAPLAAQAKPNAQIQTEMQAAWTAAAKVAVHGPGEIKLLDQATLKIGPDQVFIPAAEANRIMAALGNPTHPSRHGLIVSGRDDSGWLVDVGWIKEGYVDDEEAKDWKADSLLEALTEGTENDNKDRVARGFPALDVAGWVEQPAYDSAAHRLIWSLALRERNAPANAPQTINYNAYALGREGYFVLDLITGSNSIEADKPVARKLLASLNYGPGKRYQDFDSSTDQVAAYGIGALVGVVAAKKLGLFALIGVFLVKFWKLILIGTIAVGAFARRLLHRRQTGEDEVVMAEAESSVEADTDGEAVPLRQPIADDGEEARR